MADGIAELLLLREAGATGSPGPGNVSQVAQGIAQLGRSGDTMLAHINPQEAALLKSLGGSGTINPHTGLPEYWSIGSITGSKGLLGKAASAVGLGDVYKGISGGVSDVLQSDVGKALATAAAIYFGAPYLAELGTGSALATEAGGMAGAEGLIGGGDIFGLGSAGAGAAEAAGAGAAGAGAEGLSDSFWKQYLGAADAVPGQQTIGGIPSGLGQLANLFKSGANFVGQNPGTVLTAALLPMLLKELGTKKPMATIQPYSGALSKFKYDPSTYTPVTVTPPAVPYRAQYASGGIAALAQGGLNQPTGPVERMSQQTVGAGGMYPQSQMEKTFFATPSQMPASAEVIGADYDVKTNPYTGVMMAGGGMAEVDDLINEAKSSSDGMSKLSSAARSDKASALAALARLSQQEMLKRQHQLAIAQALEASKKPQGAAKGGLREGSFIVPADVVSHVGNGSTDAGLAALHKRMGAKPIKGQGDGMSDSIPTSIGGHQPARVADGEAVVEPEQVKRIGRGSSKAGAKKLYAMMDKVRKARTGTTKQGRQINPHKYLPA